MNLDPKVCNFEASRLLLPGGRTLDFLLATPPWRRDPIASVQDLRVESRLRCNLPLPIDLLI